MHACSLPVQRAPRQAGSIMFAACGAAAGSAPPARRRRVGRHHGERKKGIARRVKLGLPANGIIACWRSVAVNICVCVLRACARGPGQGRAGA